METVRTKAALREAIRALRGQGKTIGLVPTMGALHEGHISLVRHAAQHADAVAASIFVNPTQFGPNEDFDRYPRDEAQDLALLEQAGVALAYLPDLREMYAPGAVTRVTVPGIAGELEGAFRPGFFDGVATIVTKLFLQAAPDIALFGEKDYQQLQIIRRFTQDLDIPVHIIGAPTLREPDGLALSSRNRYLSHEERRIAPMLYAALTQVAERIGSGAAAGPALKDSVEMLLTAGFARVDYFELRDAESLHPALDAKKPARLLAAASLGTTRLIDNIPVTL